MVRVACAGLLIGFLALVCAPAGRASLHHPEDPVALVVRPDGVPEPLQYDPEFKRRRLVLMNVGNSVWPLTVSDPKTKEPVIDAKTGKPLLTERGVVSARIAEERKKKNRTPEESVALAVDLLRFGQPLEADGALAGQRRGFLPNITLAHIAIAQGEWAKAYEHLDIANEERPPVAFPGLTPQQLAWQLRLNRGPLLKLVKLRLAEAREEEARKKAGQPKRPPEDELPDRLFDVNFVNEAGLYEPGVLAPAERAKLPPDALATVQQLVLWFPHDTRLYWLLAELYAAGGEFAAADRMMDECAWSLQYGNRKVLMQHREAVAKAAKAKGPAPEEALLAPPAPVETPPEPGVLFSMRTVLIYFGVVAALALFALVRAVTRKRKAA